MSDRRKAKELYLNSNGEMALVDIAEKLDRPPGTVRGWKSKDKWDDYLGGTEQSERNDTERSEKVTEEKYKNSKNEKKSEKTIIKEIAANKDLNDKQQLFCVYYLKYFNATKAYQKAYDVGYAAANANGSRLLANDSIKAEIERLKAERMHGIYLDGKAILQQYINIAFSDITDYTEFGRREIPVMTAFGPMKDNDGEVVMQEVNYVDFKESSNIDGTIISEVSQGSNGVTVKLQDKMRALDWLTNNLERFTQDEIDLDRELMKTRIEKEKAETKIIQLDLDKATGEDIDDNNIQDFLKATTPDKEDMRELFGDRDDK